MTELEKAARQALEALKLIAAQDQGCGGNVTEAEAWRSAKSIALQNIPALRRALEQQPADKGACATCGALHEDQLIKQPAVSDERTNDEPVASAWMRNGKMVNAFPWPPGDPRATDDDRYWLDKGYKAEPLYTRPQPAAQFAGSYGTIDESAAKRIATALGWKPAAQWVGLTDEEVAVLMMEAWGCASIAPRNAPNFARAIEAKLRNKNGGKA